MVSNGEYMPVLQTPAQKQVEEEIIRMAEANSKRIGMTRREYLRSSRHGSSFSRDEQRVWQVLLRRCS